MISHSNYEKGAVAGLALATVLTLGGCAAREIPKDSWDNVQLVGALASTKATPNYTDQICTVVEGENMPVCDNRETIMKTYGTKVDVAPSSSATFDVCYMDNDGDPHLMVYNKADSNAQAMLDAFGKNALDLRKNPDTTVDSVKCLQEVDVTRALELTLNKGSFASFDYLKNRR